MNSCLLQAQDPAFHEQIFFATEQFEPLPGEWKKLEAKFKQWSLEEIVGVRLTGSCDDRGSSEFNQNLALWRANTVKKHLIDLGMSASNIQVEVQGEIALQSNWADTNQQRQQNRQVFIFFSIKPKALNVEEEIKKPIAPEAKKPQQIFTENSKVGDKIILENILFEGGRHFILPESEPAVKNLLKTLKENPKYSVIILGHICCETDGRDGFDYDTGTDNLSVERAKAIYNYLVANGVPKSRLDYKGMKSEYKLGKGDKFDRRVEIEITRIAP